jgi:hypothetical protein
MTAEHQLSVVEKQKAYFNRVVNGLKKETSIPQNAIDNAALTLRLSENNYHEMPEKWRNVLPKSPDMLKAEQVIAITAPTPEKENKPTAADIPKARAKKQPESGDNRWVRGVMQALKEVKPLPAPPPAPTLKGVMIGKLLRQLWEHAHPQTKTIEEMGANLSTVYAQVALLTPASKPHVPASKKEQPEEPQIKPKFARFIKTQSIENVVFKDIKQLSSAQERTESAVLDLAHCPPKKR